MWMLILQFMDNKKKSDNKSVKYFSFLTSTLGVRLDASKSG